VPDLSNGPTDPSAVEIVDERVGTYNRKYGLRLRDDSQVEAVLYRGDSLCISSQVGCAVGCPFCASGAKGFGRNLSLDEMHAQVASVRARGAEVARVTISGVGEPLHNHGVVGQFIRESHAAGTPVSLTSSGGPLNRLREAFTWPHRGLSLSIHAGTQSARAKAVPRGPALEPLFATLAELLPLASARRRRRLALAYLLLEGVNESQDEIEAFVRLAQPLGVKVHLYAYNPVPTSDQARATETRYQEVYRYMCDSGLDVRRSSQARVEANGGCGTLVAIRGRGHQAGGATSAP
jgi:23S rRNA (adenine2503-C2)-methyltransferase